MEKKNNILIIAIIILSILVVGLGGYIIFDKVLNNSTDVEETKKPDIIFKAEMIGCTITAYTSMEVVFEGIRAYHNDKGTAVFRLKEHVKRLFDSAKIYRMTPSYTEEEVCEFVACWGAEIIRVANEVYMELYRPNLMDFMKEIDSGKSNL